MNGSVRLSVRPSVCLWYLFHYVPVIVSSWNFQKLLPLTELMSMRKVKVRGQRSRSCKSSTLLMELPLSSIKLSICNFILGAIETHLIVSLTPWGWVMHICISKLGHHCFRYWLVTDRCQAIIWANPGILFIEPMGTNFNEILIKIHIFPLTNIQLKI